MKKKLLLILSVAIAFAIPLGYALYSVGAQVNCPTIDVVFDDSTLISLTNGEPKNLPSIATVNLKRDCKENSAREALEQVAEQARSGVVEVTVYNGGIQGIPASRVLRYVVR
jgi:hypothetical protein